MLLIRAERNPHGWQRTNLLGRRPPNDHVGTGGARDDLDRGVGRAGRPQGTVHRHVSGRHDEHANQAQVGQLDFGVVVEGQWIVRRPGQRDGETTCIHPGSLGQHSQVPADELKNSGGDHAALDFRNRLTAKQDGHVGVRGPWTTNLDEGVESVKVAGVRGSQSEGGDAEVARRSFGSELKALDPVPFGHQRGGRLTARCISYHHIAAPIAARAPLNACAGHQRALHGSGHSRRLRAAEAFVQQSAVVPGHQDHVDGFTAEKHLRSFRWSFLERLGQCVNGLLKAVPHAHGRRSVQEKNVAQALVPLALDPRHRQPKETADERQQEVGQGMAEALEERSCPRLV